MYPHIREPASVGPWLPDYTRQIERAIGDATSGLSDRITAIEEQLMTLTEAAERIATDAASIERMMVTVAAAARVQTDLLARIEAVSRGKADPRPDEEGDALIRDAINKEAR